MWTKLFYDKYASHHHFKNPITSKVTIEDLEDGSYDYFIGKQALDIYNSLFSEYFQMPKYLINSDFLNLHLYIKEVDGLQTVYAVIGINHQVLEEYVTNGKAIPHEDFVKSLLQFHLEYEGRTESYNDLYYYTSAKTQNELVEKNIQYIIDHAMTPADYTMDERVCKQKDITLDLFDYQRCSVHWMIEREKNLKTISYNMNPEIKIGNVYYDKQMRSFYLGKDRKNMTFYGGGLIDEVGLGKTLDVITLSLNNPPSNTAYIDEKGPKMLRSKATLVLCPNQLCGQWIREIKNKVSKDFDPVIIQMLTKRDFDRYTYQDLLDADFVVVSYTFLDNKAFTGQWSSRISSLKSFHRQKWSSTDKDVVNTTFASMAKKLVSNPIEHLNRQCPLIQLVHWHRLVVDEIHEVYSNDKYNFMNNIIPCIKSSFRWAVTATPFIGDAVEAISYLLDFLTGHQNQDGVKILVQNDFVEFLSTECFRRNTKKSVQEEHKLPPIQEEIRWLKFTPTERMMYNAFLANPNNDKFSTYLRQLCCHPQLADETKHCLSNCKSLQDIEKMMVQHYQKEVDEAQSKVDKMDERLKKLNKKIRKIEKKQKKRQMKKMGLKVESDSSDSDESDDDDEDDDEEIAILMAGVYNEGVGGNYDIKPTVTLTNLKESVQILEDKRKTANNELDGKTTTMNFFNNVVERVRKTVTKESGPKKEIKYDCKLDGDTNMMNFLMSQMSDSEDDSDGDSKDEDDEERCGICLDEIPEDDVGVTKCGHIFCYECLKISTAKYHTCPYCKKHLNDLDIFVLSYEKPKKEEEKKQIDMEKEELINAVGTKLANLIFYLKETKEHTIIFSQWDDLLRRVGYILRENGIQNVFCKGNVYQRDKAIREFNEDDKIKVIMLSSEKTASGTNLTKASQVVIIEPIYGTYKFRKDQERQAVGRAHRLGQKKSIKLIRFLIRSSIEEDIYKMNLEEDAKHIDAKDDTDAYAEMEIA